jgi:hypothetical protein
MVQMWLSPRDLCALAATAAARARLSRALATRMGLSSAAPEVLFAMAAFHKFYQRTYERCVNDAGSRVDQHQLVEAPELVHRILEALGFCTFLDEDGVERPLRDERGRPVCAFLGDLRHAFATGGLDPRDALYAYAFQLRNLPVRLEGIKSRLQELRPRKSSLFLGKQRIWDLNFNLDLWNELNRSMFDKLSWAESGIADRQASSLVERKYQLKLARNAIAHAKRTAETVLKKLEKLPEHRQALIENRRIKSTRDVEAETWRTTFKDFINQSWIPLVQSMDQQAEEQLESLKPSIELRSLGSRSEEPAPQVAGRPLPAPRSDSTAAPGPGPGPKPVRSKNFAAEDLCFQTHGHNKRSCDTDLACRFEPAAKPDGQGSCRLKSASPGSPGGPFVSAFIGDTPRKTKPPASSSIEELESLQAALPPATRKERKEAAKEAAEIAETERKASEEAKIAEDQTKAAKRERRRKAKIAREQNQAKLAAAEQEKRRKAAEAAKIARPQTCGQLEEQEACVARPDCSWRPDKNACVAEQTGKKSKHDKRRAACAALRNEETCKGACVWDDMSKTCVPRTLRTEDLRSEPFSPLLTSVSPALPEPEPKPAASAAKTSRHALRWTAVPSMWTVINSLPGAGSGGAEASLRAYGQPAPPAAAAPPDAGSGGVEVSMPLPTPAALAVMHGSMHSSLRNPALQRRERLRQPHSPKQQQQQKKATLTASHVGTAVAFLAALATGKLHSVGRR